jgi:hypothetical protein
MWGLYVGSQGRFTLKNSMDDVFLHFVVWTLGTFLGCSWLYYQLPLSRPFVCLLVSIGAWIVGYVKEVTDPIFSVSELWGDTWGIAVGVMLFLTLIRAVPWSLCKYRREK